MRSFVGIDLGMTYSCIAHVDETGRPVTLKNSDGFLTTPSVVFFESPENVIVGVTAKNAMQTDPEKVVAFVKWNMDDPNATYEIDGKSYRPEEVSSFVLKEIVKDASEFLRQPITDAVITVPAYFNASQWAATERAGKIAGLNVRSLLSEPIAAAISYGIDQGDDQVVLLYDLGGGTFDVTLIEVKGHHLAITCTGGDHELGGQNWDERLINYLVACWSEQNGQPNYEVEDRLTANNLRLEAERYKVQLSPREKLRATVTIEGQLAKVQLTREKFDDLTADLLDRTIELTREVLKEAAKKGVTDFDRILLVGGATRMPQVKDRLQREFCKNIVIFDPDEAVAKGAALFAHRLALHEAAMGDANGPCGSECPYCSHRLVLQEAARREIAGKHGLPRIEPGKLVKVRVESVPARAFGVIALNEMGQETVVFLIRGDEGHPAHATLPLATSVHGQRTVEVRIMESECDDITDPKMCLEFGQATLKLPEGLPKGSPIEVTFSVNDQGILEVSACEVTTGATINVAVDRAQSAPNDLEVKPSPVVPRQVIPADRENFYILLDLAPSVQDWEQIEAAIRSKRSDWSRDAATSPSQKRKRQAGQNKALLPEIERVMKDPELRRKEAEQSVERREALHQEALLELREDIAFLCAKGYVLDKEVDKLTTRYTRWGLTQEEIHGGISVQVCSVNIEEGASSRPLDKTILSDIRENLATLGFVSLYHFLGIEDRRSASCGLLRAKTAEIGQELIKHGSKIAESAARQALVGHCSSVFRSEETRKGYDQALGDAGLEKIAAKLDLMAGDTIHAQTFQLLMRIGMETGVGEKRCRNYIRAMARQRGLLVEVPALPFQHHDP